MSHSTPRPVPGDVVSAVLRRHHHEPSHLVQVLREVQEPLGWLPKDALSGIAEGLKLPLSRVEGTAAFYSFFYLRPMGRYRVLWSDNVTDRMLGSQELMKAMCRGLWLEPGRVSEDGLVSVDTTSCTGLCDQGPALLVNGRAISRMTAARVDEVVELIRAEKPLSAWPPDYFLVDDNIRRRDVLLGNALNPMESVQAALDRGPEGMLAELAVSRLRGRGGAGFTTAQKWTACRNAPGETRYVVCNADEGEPGTFKDRVLLTSHSDLVFEGMTIAGFAVGAKKGLLYLRGEYRYLLETLERALERRRAAHFLGPRILGRDFEFDIEIHLGAGAYICGEESALIESLEGKPGKPRIRPPFPVTKGYLGQPTVVNNVETLADTCLIARHGGEAWARLGTGRSTGTKLVSVSGDVDRPGVYEYPWGVSVAQVLADSGARNPQAVQVSGPSGTTLAPDDFHRTLAFEDLPSAGAFMVFDGTRDMFEVARAFAHFFAHESCGFCTPCRVGTSLVKNLLDKLERGKGSPYDLDQLFKLHRLMQTTSHCGLGATACNPLFDGLTRFRPSWNRRLGSLQYEPAFDLDAALSQARRMTGRDDADAHLENRNDRGGHGHG